MAGAQRYRQLRRTLAVLILAVLPYLPDRRFGYLGRVAVRQRRDRAFLGSAGQLVTLRQTFLVFRPGVHDFFAVSVLRQVFNRRRPAVRFVQHHFRAVAQNHRQALRALAVLVILIVPDLLDRCFGHIAVGQLRDLANHSGIGPRVTLGQIFLVFLPGVVDHIAFCIVLRHTEHHTPADFLAAQRHFSYDLIAVHQPHGQALRTLVILVVVILPNLLDKQIDLRETIGQDEIIRILNFSDLSRLIAKNLHFVNRIYNVLAICIASGQLLPDIVPVVAGIQFNRITLLAAVCQQLHLNGFRPGLIPIVKVQPFLGDRNGFQAIVVGQLNRICAARQFIIRSIHIVCFADVQFTIFIQLNIKGDQVVFRIIRSARLIACNLVELVGVGALLSKGYLEAVVILEHRLPFAIDQTSFIQRDVDVVRRDCRRTVERLHLDGKGIIQLLGAVNTDILLKAEGIFNTFDPNVDDLAVVAHELVIHIRFDGHFIQHRILDIAGRRSSFFNIIGIAGRQTNHGEPALAVVHQIGNLNRLILVGIDLEGCAVQRHTSLVHLGELEAAELLHLFVAVRQRRHRAVHAGVGQRVALGQTGFVFRPGVGDQIAICIVLPQITNRRGPAVPFCQRDFIDHVSAVAQAHLQASRTLVKVVFVVPHLHDRRFGRCSIGDGVAGVHLGGAVRGHLDVVKARVVLLVALGRFDLLHVVGAHRDILHRGNAVCIGGRHLRNQRAILLVHTEHSAFQRLVVVLTDLRQGDGTGLHLDIDHCAVDILVPATPGKLHGIAQVGPEILRSGYNDLITGRRLGLLDPVLTAGHQRSFRIAVFIRHQHRHDLRAVAVRVDGEFCVLQRLGGVGVKLTPLVLHRFYLINVDKHALEVGEVTVGSVALGRDRLVAHNRHFDSVLQADLVILGSLGFLHIVGAGLQDLRGGNTATAGGHLGNFVLAVLIGVDGELSAGQAVVVVTVHLLQGDVTAGNRVGHHKAVVLVAGVGDIEVAQLGGLLHGVGDLDAVFILDQQLIKFGSPVIGAAQRSRLAGHILTIRLELHGHFRQALQGCQALPFLLHGNGSVIVRIGDGKAIVHAAGHRGQVAGHHGSFLYIVGVGSAVGVLAGQLGELTVPVASSRQLQRLAGHGLIVLVQLHGDALGTGVQLIIIAGPDLGHGNSGGLAVGIIDHNAVIAVNAGDLTGHNRHLDGLVGLGQHEALRRLLLADVVVAGRQARDLNEAIAGVADMGRHIHLVRYRVIAVCIVVQHEFCTIQHLVRAIIIHIDLIQADRTGLGVVEVQPVIADRADVTGRHTLFLDSIGDQIAVFIILGQAGDAPLPHVGVSFLVPFDGGLGLHPLAIAVHHQRHILRTSAVRIAAVLPDLGTGQRHDHAVDQGELQIGVALLRLGFGGDVHLHILVGFRLLHHIFRLVALGVVGGQVFKLELIAVIAATDGRHLRAILVLHRHQVVAHLLIQVEGNIIGPVRIILSRIFPDLFTIDPGLFDTVGDGRRDVSVFVYFINIGVVIVRLAGQIFLDGILDFITILIEAGQIREGELPIRLLGNNLADVGIGVLTLVQVHLDFLRAAVLKAHIEPHLGAGDVDGLIVADGGRFRRTVDHIATHHVHHHIRLHLDRIHSGICRQQVAVGRLCFLYIVDAGNQAILALDHIAGICIAAPLGGHHAHHLRAFAIAVDGELSALQVGVGLSVHLLQGHVAADHVVDESRTLRIAITVDGDDLVAVFFLRQRNLDIRFRTHLITVGGFYFPDIICYLVLPQRHLLNDRHTVTVGSRRSNQRIGILRSVLGTIARQLTGINAKLCALQLIAELVVLHNSHRGIAVVLLVDEFFFGNDPLAFPLPITSLFPTTAANSLHGLAGHDRYFSHFSLEVVVLQRRDFLDPIRTGSKQFRLCLTFVIGRQGHDQAVFGAAVISINAEHSAGQIHLIRHVDPLTVGRNAPIITQTGLFQRQPTAVHFHPGLPAQRCQSTLVNFLTVVHIIGNDGTVMYFLDQFHIGLGRQQGAAVTGGGLNGAFKGLHDAVFVSINKVKNHTLAAVGICRPPHNAFAAALTFFIKISNIRRVCAHEHFTVLTGADEVDDHIFVFGHWDTIPAHILLYLENTIRAHFGIVKGYYITVIRHRPGYRGTTGGIGGQAGDFTATQVSYFLGEFFSIIQQLIGIAALFHITHTHNLVAVAHKLTVHIAQAVHFGVAHGETIITICRRIVLISGIIIIHQYTANIFFRYTGDDFNIFVLLRFLIEFFIISAGFRAKGQGGGIFERVKEAHAVAFTHRLMDDDFTNIVIIPGRGRYTGTIIHLQAQAVLLAIRHIAIPICLEHIQTGVLQILFDFPGQIRALHIVRHGFFRAFTAHIFFTVKTI